MVWDSEEVTTLLLTLLSHLNVQLSLYLCAWGFWIDFSLKTWEKQYRTRDIILIISKAYRWPFCHQGKCWCTFKSLKMTALLPRCLSSSQAVTVLWNHIVLHRTLAVHALYIDRFKCFWLEEIRVERQSDCGGWWMGIPLLLWILQRALYIKETIWVLNTLE